MIRITSTILRIPVLFRAAATILNDSPILSQETPSQLSASHSLRILSYEVPLHYGYPRWPAELSHLRSWKVHPTSSKSVMESYFSSMASITLLVNLNGLAVDAITVLVSSFVSALYFPYTLAATAVCVSKIYPVFS